MSAAIIDKIRKLLNRNGRTEAEADTAQILAAALAEKHGLDLADIDRTDPARTVVIMHREVGVWGRCPEEATYASLICKRFFEVSTFELKAWSGSSMVFVGTEQHLAIAEYVFQFLIGEFRRAWNRRPNKRLKSRKGFMWGAFVALLHKLEDRYKKPEPAQLELALEVSLKAKRDAYIDEHWGSLKFHSSAPARRKGAATVQGYYAGKDIEIRPGVNGNAQAQRQHALPGTATHLLPSAT